MELLKYPSLVFSLIDDKNESRVVGNGNECFDSEMTLLLGWGQKEIGAKSSWVTYLFQGLHLPMVPNTWTYSL